MQEFVSEILLPIFEVSCELEKLYKKQFGKIVKDYSYTEMHCIDAIEKLQNPNITKIAQSMHLTKAGVSKILKKLLEKKAVEIYTNPPNKKEIYYKLTTIGKDVFKAHVKLHKIWCDKDKEFFGKLTAEEREKTFIVMEKYSNFLQERLKHVKETSYEKDL